MHVFDSLTYYFSRFQPLAVDATCWDYDNFHSCDLYYWRYRCAPIFLLKPSVDGSRTSRVKGAASNVGIQRNHGLSLGCETPLDFQATSCCARPSRLSRRVQEPIFKYSGPKSHEGYGFWNQSPQALATWTLWVCAHTLVCRVPSPRGAEPLSYGRLLNSPTLSILPIKSVTNFEGNLQPPEAPSLRPSAARRRTP